MNITYRKVGDYLIPNLIVAESNNDIVLGKYARLRLSYLKQHKKSLYIVLKMNNELSRHLAQVQELACQQVESITKEVAIKQNITEKLKTENQIKWVGAMNNIKAVAQEIVLNELIYV